MNAPIKMKVDGRDAVVSYPFSGIVKVLFDDGECIFGVTTPSDSRSETLDREKRLALVREIEADLAGQRFNPNHEPAGSPTGGQFTSGDGGGASGEFVASGKSTETLHKDSASGKYSAERAALHQSVIDKTLAGHTAVTGRAPVATILGGGTASGKTTVSQTIIGKDPNTLRIDPDEIKLAIPEYSDLKAGDPQNAAMRVHEESSYLTKQIVAKAIANKLDFTYDSTTSGNGGVAIAKTLIAQGYDTHVLFVDLPIAIAKERAILRSQGNNPINKGRIVPDHIITESHRGAAEKFFELTTVPGLNDLRLYDNSGTAPKLVYEKSKGQEGVIHDRATFERYQRKAKGLD